MNVGTEGSTAPSVADWTDQARSLQLNGRAFVDGVHVDARSGSTFESINPATGEVIATVAQCDESDIGYAVRAARRAFDSGDWSRAAPSERRAVLLRLANLVEERRAEFAAIESLDTGKLVSGAYAGDVPETVRVLRWFAEAIDKVYDEIGPTAENQLAMVTREPLGVVGAVVPWNFPLLLAVWKIAPALAIGNSVVVKPAEQASLSIIRFAELAFEAGVPTGVLNVVPGYGDTAGAALGLHDDVDCVCFTGSTVVGKLFLAYSGRSNMKAIWLECGGKSPFLVFEDTSDLDRAAKAAAAGIFQNQGQVCSATSRVLVERSIHAEFLERLSHHALSYVPGNPLDPASTMGALIDEAHTQKVLADIAAASEDGAPVIGGHRVMVDDRGCFVEATVFDEVAATSRLASEEIFGPVLAVCAFESEEEAVGLANGTSYGLAAAVWTDDLRRAHRVARRVRAGTVSVNTVDAINVAVPFGGFKQSGLGRDLSLHAIDKYTGLKTTWIDLA